jgi:hypothetical protein
MAGLLVTEAELYELEIAAVLTPANPPSRFDPNTVPEA